MNNLITLSQNIVNIQNELNEIGAKARLLKGPGRELLPLKSDMLFYLPANERDAIMSAVELLFASVLQYVDGQINEKHARTSVDLVAARIEQQMADGTISALIHGSTSMLLLAACYHAPIAMHAIMQSAPELDIRKRLENKAFQLDRANNQSLKSLKNFRKHPQ